MARRYFELGEGTSGSFWEVWNEKGEVRTRFGKIGATGQTTITEAGSPAAALQLYDRLVAEKIGAGFEEKTAGPSGPFSEKVTAPMEPQPKPPGMKKP